MGFSVSFAGIVLDIFGLVSIVSLIYSIMGMVQIHNEKDKQKGLGFAIAGLVISILFILVGASNLYQITNYFDTDDVANELLRCLFI
ncbi:MAG: DUF4190 domain-containing protein [Oscillospiraceae bacterium]